MSVTIPAIAAYAAKTKRKFKGRNTYVGASEVGQCIRRTFFSKHDKGGSFSNEDYVDGWGAAMRGNSFEASVWVPAMRAKFGKDLLFSGKDQQSFKVGNVSATPDGLLINQPKDLLASLMVPDIGPSRAVVLDCKTIDPRINLNDAKEEHVFQVQTQIGCIRRATPYQPDYGLLCYTNASFFDDSIEFVVKFDPEIFKQAQRRADAVMAAASAAQLKPEGWISGGKECGYCPYTDACGVLRHNVPTHNKPVPIEPQFLEEMRSLAIEERKWSAAKDSAEEKQRDIQHQIKENFRAKNLRQIKDGDTQILWSSVVGRPSWDTPALRKAAEDAGLDLSPYERTGKPSDRLVIAIKKRDRLVR